MILVHSNLLRTLHAAAVHYESRARQGLPGFPCTLDEEPLLALKAAVDQSRQMLDQPESRVIVVTVRSLDQIEAEEGTFLLDLNRLFDIRQHHKIRTAVDLALAAKEQAAVFSTSMSVFNLPGVALVKAPCAVEGAITLWIRHRPPNEP